MEKSDVYVRIMAICTGLVLVPLTGCSSTVRLTPEARTYLESDSPLERVLVAYQEANDRVVRQDAAIRNVLSQLESNERLQDQLLAIYGEEGGDRSLGRFAKMMGIPGGDEQQRELARYLVDLKNGFDRDTPGGRQLSELDLPTTPLVPDSSFKAWRGEVARLNRDLAQVRGVLDGRSRRRAGSRTRATSCVPRCARSAAGRPTRRSSASCTRCSRASTSRRATSWKRPRPPPRRSRTRTCRDARGRCSRRCRRSAPRPGAST